MGLTSVTNKAEMHIIFQLQLMTQVDKVWIFELSLYIVDFTNVSCAYNFVCLLVELRINACITYQVIKIGMMMRIRPFLLNNIKNIYFSFSIPSTTINMVCYQDSPSLLKSFIMVGLPTSNTKYMHAQKMWNLFYIMQ